MTVAAHFLPCSGQSRARFGGYRPCARFGVTTEDEFYCHSHQHLRPVERRREADTGRCESCNGLHSDCGDA